MRQVPRGVLSVAQVPLKIEQVAATYQLGTLWAKYRNSTDLFFWGSLWFVCVGIASTFIFFYSPDLNRTWWGWLLLLAFLLLLLLGIYYFLVHTNPLHVFVYPEGLIYSRKNQVEVIRWDQVEGYWEDVKRIQPSPEYPGDKVKSYSYSVQRSDGMTFEFPSDIEQIENLGRLIKQNVDRHLLPRTLSAWHAGTSITFGNIRVNQQEIHIDGSNETLLWSDFENFDLDEVVINVYRKGQQKAWYHQRIAKITSPGVLQSLLDSIVQERVQQQLSQTIAAYKMGSAVLFGRISLNQQGIVIDSGKKVLSWSDVKRVDVDIQRRQVSIHTYSQLLSWQTFPIWMTPGAYLLKRLVDAVLQEHKYHTEVQIQSQLPQLIASYNAGIPLTFGRLTLSLQGVAIDGGKQFLPWQQVSRMYIGTYIGGDRLTIVKKGKLVAWQALPLSHLGDVELLKGLIEHIMNIAFV